MEIIIFEIKMLFIKTKMVNMFLKYFLKNWNFIKKK